MIDAKAKEQLWELIKPIKKGMLCSWNGEFIHARPMYHVNDRFDGLLYYFTHVNSQKVEEINKYDEVCLTYADTDKDHYISLSGVASITQDKTLIDKYWNSIVGAWFPDGKDSPDTGLLQVYVYKAEIWDGESNLMVELFKIAKANLTNIPPHMGEHKKFG